MISSINSQCDRSSSPHHRRSESTSSSSQCVEALPQIKDACNELNSLCQSRDPHTMKSHDVFYEECEYDDDEEYDSDLLEYDHGHFNGSTRPDITDYLHTAHCDSCR